MNTGSSPFSQMILHISIWNKKLITVEKACISQEIPSSRNDQVVVINGRLINPCIRCWSLLASESICEPKIKWAAEKTILRCEPLLIYTGKTPMIQRCSMNVAAINCFKCIFEKWPELWLVTQIVLIRWLILWCQLMDIFWKEWW